MGVRLIHQPDGVALDATFAVEAINDKITVVIESRGGTRGAPNARNLDYARGFELLLGRLQEREAQIIDATLDSMATRHLPAEARRLQIEGKPFPITIDDPGDLQRRLGAAQARTGRGPDATGSGNRTKRVRLVLGFLGPPPSPVTLEAELAGQRGAPRHWALFADPETYRIDDAIGDPRADAWVTAGRPIRRGDRVVIWRGKGRGDRRGIVAFGEVLSDPQEKSDNANPHWLSPPPVDQREPRVPVRYVVPPKLPLWVDEHAQVLGALSVARARGGTVFNVTDEQWEAVIELAGGWPSATPARSPGSLGSPYMNVGQLPASAPRDAFAIDPDKVDRGTQAHASTQDGLASFLRSQGVDPRSPGPGEPEFDLAWEHDGIAFVAEVKSITDANEEKQLRLGLGQVLRYRQALAHGGRHVVGVLVPERRPTEESWLELSRELHVLLVWPASFDALLAPGPSGDAT